MHLAAFSSQGAHETLVRVCACPQAAESLDTSMCIAVAGYDTVLGGSLSAFCSACKKFVNMKNSSEDVSHSRFKTRP